MARNRSSKKRVETPCAQYDFVILSRGCAAQALAWTRTVMTKLGLTLNEAKTSVKDARAESFDFLGYSLETRWYPKTTLIFGKLGVLRLQRGRAVWPT